MKILYITTVGVTMGFFRSFIANLLEAGHTVDIACNETESPVHACYREWGCRVFPLSCTRSPLSGGNLTAVSEIRELVRRERYDIVHCHSPIAAACTRIACRGLRRQGVRVIYTAHGFHFYQGAPLKNWLVFYPVEKLCARWTDALITINHEDYTLAQRKMHAKRVEYVPGVGLDVEKFAHVTFDRAAKRRELGVPEDAFLLLSVGELNENKNHETVIRALAQLPNTIHYVIAGEGPLRSRLLSTAKEAGAETRVHLLGYRTDVAELDHAADAYVLPSFRKGLNVSLMEAMAAGLPCIASDIRGNRELVRDGETGFLCPPGDAAHFAAGLRRLVEDASLRSRFGACGMEHIKQFSKERVEAQLLEIYKECLEGSDV